jgi:hypothetical protein
MTGGFFELFRVPTTIKGITALGYPAYTIDAPAAGAGAAPVADRG